MKKKWIRDAMHYVTQTKMWKIMRLSAFFIFLFLSQVWAGSGYSQQTKLTLRMNNVKVIDVLDEIENKSEFFFLFNQRLIDVERIVDVNVEQESIDKILMDLFDNTNVRYQVKDRQIILTTEKTAFGEEADLTQQRSISGKVVDESGEPLPGVSVIIKGTTTGTITDFDGNFNFANLPGDATLVLSFVGMKTQEIEVSGQTTFNITMEEDAIGIEEVVAIGYGTQKKANLTGATAIVDSEELVKRPVSNAGSLLQGRVSGLNIIQNSGQPGDEGLDIKIRGISTFGNTTPYVLIDGIEGNLSALNPGDVESITVLKDASSAAIYGSRAANGVILVTTKSGKKDQMIVEAHVNMGFQQATRLPDFIYNSVEYMEMWNKGAAHVGVPVTYPLDLIESYRNASPGDPRYPNFNWMDHLFKTALRQDYQLSVSGGGENNTFFLNFGYMDQEGIMEGYGAKKYSTRIKLDLDLNESMTLGFNSGFVYRDEWEPTNDNIYEQMLYAYTMPPTMTPYLSDGSGRFSYRDIPEIWRNRNPQAVVDNPGYTRYDKYEISPQAYIDIHPFKGFSWKTTAAWRYDRTEIEHMYEEMVGYVFTTNELYGAFEPFSEGVYHNNYRSSNIYLNSVINYERTIKENHNFNVIAGYEQHEMNYDGIYVRRPGYSSTTTTDIDAGSPENQEVSGNTSSWALQSLFGRLSYNYKGKYLLEGNIRYDGTSKIAKDNRWDLFPSMSVGWRISEESFMDQYGWIDNLKLRASVGQLGNQGTLSDYPYQQLLSNSSYPIGGALQTGVSSPALSNPELLWEVVTSYNLGLDFSMRNGLFGIELDVYKKEVEGGHATAQIPASVGKTAPQENYRNMENTGFELALRHAHKVGELKYNMAFLIDRYKNKVTKVKDDWWGYQRWYGRTTVEGHPLNEFYMLDWIGIYQNQSEIDNLPIYEPYRNITQPGDLIFRDVNGDGEITIESETGDRVFISGYHPKFSYSYTANFEWKNFDLSMFWQGVAGKKAVAQWIGYEPFFQGGPVTTKWRDAWDGEGSTNSMPALYNNSVFYGYQPINGIMNDFHLANTSYLRLKNLQIGYNMSQSVCKKLGVSKLRMYVSGDNLITISDFDFDPERGSSQFTANTYPQLTTYSIGAKLTF